MNYLPGRMTSPPLDRAPAGGRWKPSPRPRWRESRAESPLTARQLECLCWAGEGKSSVDIGCILDISAATVNEHLRDACRRLGVRTRVQAIVESYRQGWLE